ncbi:MAG: DinB family protein [Microlunatus sp.]|nr:DinB family protein [Microlunatus sp.]
MDQKSVLKRYYNRSRDSFLWKLEGLSERRLRMPLTPTGTNLLGLLKHVASVDVGYLGLVFGRPFSHPVQERIDADPVTDMWAAADEPAELIKDFARQAWAHTDRTIEELDLDATGRVPWWGPDSPDVTLHWILVHVISENAQHLGHADVVRELTDGLVGLRRDATNLPELTEQDWADHTGRLQAIAESFPA